MYNQDEADRWTRVDEAGGLEHQKATRGADSYQVRETESTIR